MTRDYNAGKRARYSSPLKLYLVASVLFVLAVAPGESAAPHPKLTAAERA